MKTTPDSMQTRFVFHLENNKTHYLTHYMTLLKVLI